MFKRADKARSAGAAGVRDPLHARTRGERAGRRSRHAGAGRPRRRAADAEHLGAAGLLSSRRPAGDRERVHDRARRLGARASRRPAARVGDARPRAAQDQAAARGGGRTAARRRVDRQLLAAAVRERRAAARAVLARRGSRRLPAVHDPDAVRRQRATCSACGTRPTAACSSTARIWCRCRRAPGTSCSTRPAASRASRRCPAISTTPAGGRRRSSITWRCSGRRAASWSTRDGRPILGEEPNRRAMLRVLGFLRDTIQRGASPRSVLGHTDYQQMTGAAVAGDAAMFLGGNWQLKDLQTGLSPAEFAKWDIAPIPQAEANTRSTGTGGWVWVVFAKDPGAAEGGGRVHPRRRGARPRRAHQRGDRPSAGAAQRLSRLSRSSARTRGIAASARCSSTATRGRPR